MKPLYLFPISLLLSFLVPNCAIAEDYSGPGRIHRIDVNASHPKAYHPAIGDIVQCYLNFPIVREHIPDDLRITIDGNSLSLVAIANTPKPKIVGSGQMSAFFIPRQAGLSKITIQPVIPGQKPKPIKINLLVQMRKPR